MTVPRTIDPAGGSRRGADTRAILLAAAANILSDQGWAALTVRRIAEAVKASTKMVYTHFGGMDGLLDALYRESFGELTTMFEEAASLPDPADRLLAVADRYRMFALANPSRYRVMFGDAGRGWEPPLASRRAAWRSFQTVREDIAAAFPDIADGALRITYLLWATMHGVLSLELRDLINPPEHGAALYRSAVEAVLRGEGLVRVDIGHEPT